MNPWLQHWQVPNLWVAGGSAFPQNGSGNPTLTILATTLRAADALVERYLKKPGAFSMKRREFIVLPAQSLGGVLLYTLAGEPMPSAGAGDGRNKGPAAILHGGGGSRGAGCGGANFSQRRERSGRDRGRSGDLHRPPARRAVRARQVSLHQGAVCGFGAGARLSGQGNAARRFIVPALRGWAISST